MSATEVKGGGGGGEGGTEVTDSIALSKEVDLEVLLYMNTACI